MNVELNIPDINELELNSSSLMIKRVLEGGGQNEKKVYALYMNFVRIVDLVCESYKSARLHAHRIYNTHDSIAAGSIVLAGGYLEQCISDLKRSIDYLKVIRKYVGVPQELKDTLPKGLSVLSGPVEGKVTAMRGIIQHLVESLSNGKISDAEAMAVTPRRDGFEIGPHVVTYVDLRNWIIELHGCAKKVVDIGMKNNESADHGVDTYAD